MKKNKKILTAFLMLIVTAVTLTTASYAWFSSNTSVSLGDLNVNVTAANGIQVSLDAQNWKATLDLSTITAQTAATDEVNDLYADNTNQVPTEVSPVSTVGTNGATGIFRMYSGEFTEGDSSKLTTALLTDTKGTTGKYIAFDLFVKSATDEDIYLNTGSGVTTLGESTGLENAVRVGFLNKGTDTTNNAATARTLAGDSDAEGALDGEQVIWEPNSNSHTAVVISSGVAEDGASLSYSGVKAAGTGLAINSSTSFSEVTTLKTQATITAGTNKVFAIKAGITKIRVYIWLEGQDVDCEDNASLGTGFTTSIRLMKQVAGA